jgi:hypothetical protein
MTEPLCEICGENPAVGFLQLFDIKTQTFDEGVGVNACEECGREAPEDSR